MPEVKKSEQPLRLNSDFTIRNATTNDLDEIVDIVQAGYPYDPEVEYRSILRYKDPEARWTRREFQGYIEQPEKFVVHLVMASKPIALAGWDIAVLTKPNRAGIIQPLL